MSLTKNYGDLILKETRFDWGGKNTGLMKLAQFTNVPSGFAISTDAYRTFINDADIDIESVFEQDVTPEEASAEIQEQIEEASLPYDLQEEIISQTEPLETPLAARSSAVEEDGDENSMAGVMESELHLQNTDELLDGIKQVYKSGFKPEGIQYRKKRGLDQVEGIGVAVLEMIEPQAGGVVFTTSPNNPDQMSIEAAETPWDVVEGESTDHYWVEKEDIPANANTANYDHKNENNDPSVMSAEQITQIAQEAQQIEQSFNEEMDIEYVFEEETGDLYILQARPMTEEINYEPEFDLSPAEGNRQVAEGEYFRNPGAMTLPVVVLPDSDPMQGYELDGHLEQVQEEYGDTGYVIATAHMNPDIINDLENAEGIIASQGRDNSHAATIAGDYGLTYMGGTDENPEEILSTGETVVLEYNGQEGQLFQP